MRSGTMDGTPLATENRDAALISVNDQKVGGMLKLRAVAARCSGTGILPGEVRSGQNSSTVHNIIFVQRKLIRRKA